MTSQMVEKVAVPAHMISKAITDNVRTRYGARQYSSEHGWFTRVHFSGVDGAVAAIQRLIDAALQDAEERVG